MSKTITVTQEDIDQGIQGDEYYCPLALAAAREYGLERGQVAFNPHADISTKMKNFIARFDEGAVVEPDTFVMENDEGDELNPVPNCLLESFPPR